MRPQFRARCEGPRTHEALHITGSTRVENEIQGHLIAFLLIRMSRLRILAFFLAVRPCLMGEDRRCLKLTRITVHGFFHSSERSLKNTTVGTRGGLREDILSCNRSIDFRSSGLRLLETICQAGKCSQTIIDRNPKWTAGNHARILNFWEYLEII